MSAEIFISYSRKDISKAKKIKEEIERVTSLSCWMDLDGIESGSQFEDVIISAIDNSRLVIFLLSNNSMHSRWTKDEVRYAYETRKKIIPVNIDNCTPSGWFLFKFSGFDVIDYSDSYQKQKFYSDISEWIGGNITNEQTNVKNEDKKKSTCITRYQLCAVCHYIVFGAILTVMSSMFFFGLLSMKEGAIAIRYNVLLCFCLCGTLYSTYLVFTNKKMRGVYLISILDIAEIILLCAIAKRITGYSLLSGYHYHSFPYMQINGLGWEMANRGEIFVTILMEVFALVHITLLIGILCIRINGKRLWDSLK